MTVLFVMKTLEDEQ